MSQYLKHNAANWSKIEHIIVLMLENRSFDNLLGWLEYNTSGYTPNDQYFNGVNNHLFNPLSNIDADGNPFFEQVFVRQNGQAPYYGGYAAKYRTKYQEDFTQPDPDPGEGYRDTNQQLFGVYSVDDTYPPDPTMAGFVDNYKNAMLYGTYSFGDAPTDPRNIMNCFTPAQTPVLSTLAQQFAVCDEWFCSVPSQTWPNRAFAIAASSDGNVNNRPDWVITSRTVFDQLTEASKSWKVYSGIHYDKDAKRDTPFSLTRIMLTPEKAIRYSGNFVLFDRFYADLKDGKLPAFSFLEPQFSTVTDKDGKVIAEQNDQHPPSDIRTGEQFMAAVYNAVIASSLWEKTLLIFTYDEHGGCYDHVAPSSAKTPIPALLDADGKPVMVTPAGASQPIPAKSDCFPLDPFWGFRFNRYGVRVPTVLISPWIQSGTVARPESYYDSQMLEPGQETSRYYDHTSIIASLRNCFGLAGCLTDRDRYAPDLSGVLSLETARTDKPTVTPLSSPNADADAESHLELAISDHLAGRTGVTRKPDEKASDHIARSHAALVASEFQLPPTAAFPTCQGSLAPSRKDAKDAKSGS